MARQRALVAAWRADAARALGMRRVTLEECADALEATIGSEDDGFEVFWGAYPRKTAKLAARQAWVKHKLGPKDVDTILAALARQTCSLQWRKDGGQFIPHPATWLNQGRWMDEPLAFTPDDEPLTPRELAKAELVRQRHYGGCPHDPRCTSYRDCIEALALAARGA